MYFKVDKAVEDMSKPELCLLLAIKIHIASKETEQRNVSIKDPVGTFFWHNDSYYRLRKKFPVRFHTMQNLHLSRKLWMLK